MSRSAAWYCDICGKGLDFDPFNRIESKTIRTTSQGTYNEMHHDFCSTTCVIRHFLSADPDALAEALAE